MLGRPRRLKGARGDEARRGDERSCDVVDDEEAGPRGRKGEGER